MKNPTETVEVRECTTFVDAAQRCQDGHYKNAIFHN